MKSARGELTEDEMRYIALLESVTCASGRDCVVDDEHGRVLYVVDRSIDFECSQTVPLGVFDHAL